MNDIFISYKVHNRAKAIEYYRVLKTQGYTVWLDQFVPKGANWRETIFEQISNSKLVLCLLSEACLLDDWVTYQLDTANFFHKQIVYITLDETNWLEHAEIHLEKRTYNDLEELLSLDPFFVKTENKEEKEKKPFSEPIVDKINLTKLLNPVINIGVLCISILLTFMFGIHFFRLSLDAIYGYVLIGILVILGLSYIKKWYVYGIECLGSLALLGVTIYILPTYYVSGISVNGLVFLAFYVFSISLRYSKMKLWFAIPAALVLSSIIVALDAAILIFFDTVLNIEMYWFSMLLLCAFLFYIGWSNRKDLKTLKKENFEI